MKAFPVQESVPQDDDYEGMDLRDYFAAKAMQGLLSNPSMIDSIEPTSADWISERSYEIADQMMEARNEG